MNTAVADRINKAAEMAPWKVLIVDDDQAVHAVTRLVFSDAEFQGRSFEFHSAYSAAEAKTLLHREPDAAALLLDVVMETDHAGLDLVNHIRDDLGNQKIRIILRTGQPGRAPQKDVIVQYGISDYREKSGLSYEALFATLVASLRAYNELSDADDEVATSPPLDSLLLTSLKCNRITSAAEMADIQQFRVKPYVEELGKAANSNAEVEPIADIDDDGARHYVCRMPDGELVGSCRVHIGDRIPAAIIDQLGIAEFCNQHDHPVAYLSKLMYAPGKRGRAAVARLLSHIYGQARDAGAVVFFAHSPPEQAPLFVRVGYHRFGAPYTNASGPQVPLVNILEDAARYERILSPLIKDCLCFPNDLARVENLRDWFLNRLAWQGELGDDEIA